MSQRAYFSGDHRNLLKVHLWGHLKETASSSGTSNKLADLVNLLESRHFIFHFWTNFESNATSQRKCLAVVREFTLEDFPETQEKEIWSGSFVGSGEFAKLASNWDMVLWYVSSLGKFNFVQRLKFLT